MDQDHKLAQVLVEFAHTLGTDFSLESILDHLVQRVVDVLPVTAAGVMLMGQGLELHFLAASNTTIQEIETLQNEYGEGPCLEAFQSGEAVAVPDLSAEQRFPRFCPRALDAGMAAVFTFPMRLDGHRMGALDLYRDTVGLLDDADLRAAQVLADVAAAYVFNAQARAAADEALTLARHLSLHDELTGLPNRGLFLELAAHALAGSRRKGHTVGVIYVDLDRFKSVNDRFGHRTGDLLLNAVALRLRDVLRSGDVLARLAGDELAILCEDLDSSADIERVAERINRCMSEPFGIDGRTVAIAASVGVAMSVSDQDTPETLLHDADFAMYEAKAAGGAQYRMVDRAARVAADHGALLEDELRIALSRGELTLAYQPICRADDQTLTAVEALLRWNHPTRGAIPPAVVIPIAERTGIIHPLGRWVLRQACTDFVRWQRDYPGAVDHLAVNLSAQQVMSPTLAPMTTDVLAETGMEAGRLHLEVTESIFLDPRRARGALQELTELGVHLSLDDFGTGYSSLEYLRTFPFDDLKIDRAFIADLIEDDPAPIAILTSVISLSHALHMTVVSEGVETAQQLAIVVALGGQLAQGFYLSPPVAADDLERRLEEHAAHDGPLRFPLPA